MVQELWSIFPLLRQIITFSKILFSRLLLLNRITWTLVLETLRVFHYLRKKYLISYNLPQILFSIFTVLKEFNFITRLRLGLSHLRKHKFKHSFQDTIIFLCNGGQNIESSTIFFLPYLFFIIERRTLPSTISSLDSIRLYRL